MGGDRVELFDDQASGVVLLQVIDELDRPFRIAGVRSHEQTRPQPDRGRDVGAIYGWKRKKTNCKILDSLDDLWHEPRAGGQHGGLTGIGQRVGIIVGDVAYVLWVVTTLHEVPEHEVGDFHYLGD